MTAFLPFTGFRYLSLPGGDFIRLLILHPDSPGAEIRCDLIHVSMSQCNEDIFRHYTALSYAWGDPKKKHTIFVNKKRFKIATNLFNALHHLRDNHLSLRLGQTRSASINQTWQKDRSKWDSCGRSTLSHSSLSSIWANLTMRSTK